MMDLVLSDTYWKCQLPPGSSGDVTIEKFEVKAVAEQELNQDPNPVPGWARRQPGWYTRLIIGTTIMMTDLYEEWWSQRQAIHEARTRGGNVLISGLGLGLILDAILKPEDSLVTRVTVLEKNPDVIQLVAPYFLQKYPDKLTIIQSDALAWSPPENAHYQVVWHDIWPYPRLVPQEEIDCLHDKFAGRSEWQGFWTEASFE